MQESNLFPQGKQGQACPQSPKQIKPIKLKLTLYGYKVQWLQSRGFNSTAIKILLLKIIW